MSAEAHCLETVYLSKKLKLRFYPEADEVMKLSCQASQPCRQPALGINMQNSSLGELSSATARLHVRMRWRETPDPAVCIPGRSSKMGRSQETSRVFSQSFPCRNSTPQFVNF